VRLAVLAGGIGAARFLRGLVQVTDPAEVTVVVNTGDDDTFHGLHVSPDLDTVTYTLGGGVNPETGWGLLGDTFRVLGALERYGRRTWFRLGDADLATHLARTERLRGGATLSAVTAEIAAAWQVPVRLLPMSDDPVSTRIEVDGPAGLQELRMQEWFVRDRAEPPVVAIRFAGAERARPAPDVLACLRDAALVVVCPSNPLISIGPILAVPGIRDALTERREQTVAVSPIIAGAAVKGPADRMLDALGHDVSCVGVASMYQPWCGTLVIDQADAARAPEIAALGVRPVVAPTLMAGPVEAAALARVVLGALDPAAG
jgi:LPPG:FO 2-phospho-L-lactate transferase